MGNDSRLSDARPASDVSSWAKASTKPSYTSSEVGLGNVGNFKAVSTVANQGLTDTEKANARANIGAGTSSFSGSYNDLSNKPTIPSLSDEVNSTSSTVAASSKAVKTAYDLAASKTSNTGTVTSVAASGSNGITISGSPITTSGTINVGLNLSTAINGLSEGGSLAERDDYAVVQSAGGGTTTTTYHRRKLSNVFAALNQSDITTALGYTPPTTDTKNTAGSTDTSSKIFLVGATSQAENPQTYSDNEVYATSGVLTTKSTQIGGGAATLQYNTTTQSIDFVFA